MMGGTAYLYNLSLFPTHASNLPPPHPSLPLPTPTRFGRYGHLEAERKQLELQAPAVVDHPPLQEGPPVVPRLQSVPGFRWDNLLSSHPIPSHSIPFHPIQSQSRRIQISRQTGMRDERQA